VGYVGALIAETLWGGYGACELLKNARGRFKVIGIMPIKVSKTTVARLIKHNGHMPRFIKSFDNFRLAALFGFFFNIRYVHAVKDYGTGYVHI
jgi:hypothetical protein